MYPNVWGGFLRYDEMGRIALDLAEKVVRSQDGLRYTLTIREGAKYASGNMGIGAPGLLEEISEKALRLPRLGYPRGSRGIELDALDKLSRDLRAVRAAASLVSRET